MTYQRRSCQKNTAPVKGWDHVEAFERREKSFIIFRRWMLSKFTIFYAYDNIFYNVHCQRFSCSPSFLNFNFSFFLLPLDAYSLIFYTTVTLISFYGNLTFYRTCYSVHCTSSFHLWYVSLHRNALNRRAQYNMISIELNVAMVHCLYVEIVRDD